MPTFRKIKIGKKTINAEVADSYLKRALGLMFRAKGRMLFEFALPLNYGIWMAFMIIPIDIIFIGRNNKIMKIVENAQPMTLNPKTWKIFFSGNGCRYVLETESGFAKKNKVRIGQKLQI